VNAAGNRTNVPSGSVKPVSSGSKGSAGTAAYDRTMQTADVSRLGSTAKSTLAAPSYNRTALTADKPRGAAAERQNIYFTADGHRTNVAGGARNSGLGSPTAMEKGESIARLGGTVPSNSSPTGGYQGGPVDEAYVARRTEELLTQYAEEAEQRYRDYDVGLNVRSAEGMARRAEKQERYGDWKLAEAYLNAYIDKIRMAKYGESIGAGVANADKVLREKGLNDENYPKNSRIYSPTDEYASEEEMLSNMGSTLNRLTEVSGQEHMCNLFKVTERDGTVKYVTSAVRTGMDNNVILPYITTGLLGTDLLAKGIENIGGKNVEYLGMLHSHPQWYNNTQDNDQFSWGDSLVAALSGKIYLTTPHGEVYALEREDGKELIGPGMKRERIVKKKKRTEKERYPDWLKKAEEENFVDNHDAKSKGRNYVTFDVKSYDTRKR